MPPLLRFVPVFCFVLLISDTKGQSREGNPVKISSNLHHGYVLPEYSNFNYIVNAPVRSLSLNISKTTRGKNYWEVLYNYPEYGISFLYSTLGNDDVNGRAIALVPFFRLNIVSRKNFRLYNESGLGTVYVTKRFDLEKNHLNIAVGSHLNVHFNLKFGISHKLSQKLALNAGLAFDHFSNANTRNPNLGINWLTGFAGMSFVRSGEYGKLSPEIEPHRRHLSFEGIASIGGKRTRGLLRSELYYTSSVTFEAKWHVTRAIRLGLGADLFLDTSTETEMLASGNNEYRPSDDFRSGIHLSQHFVYSRLSLILQEGLYVGLTNKVDRKSMYNRAIVRINVSKNSFVQVAMKSHLHVLDYPELGFGRTWR